MECSLKGYAVQFCTGVMTAVARPDNARLGK